MKCHDPLSLVKLHMVIPVCCFFTQVAFYTDAEAQSPITAVSTHWSNATTSTTYTGTGATGNASSGLTGNTYTYKFGSVVTTPNMQYLDSFTALSLTYKLQAVNEVVQFRRVNNSSVTGLRKSLWFTQPSSTTISAGGTAQLVPAYDDSLERLFSEQIFNIGIDNDFENSTNTNNNNVERVDVIFPGGISVTDVTKAGFAIFDRGASGGHDPFYIAAIRSLDASGNPSGYYNALSVAASNYGSVSATSVPYLTLRKNPGDGNLLLMNNTASQQRDGVLVRLTDLGVANNTVIYGYSLFGTDVSVSPATNMIDYTNATNFPTGSDYNNGGIDQVAVTGFWATSASYVVLADRLSGFSAIADNGCVKLSWTLGIVDDLSQMVIERSSDGINFISLPINPALSPGAGSATDMYAMPGQNYYRLKLLDKTGAVVEYSTVNSVMFATAKGITMRLFPNPVSAGRLTMVIQGLERRIYYMRVYDLVGTAVLVQRVDGAPTVSSTISLPYSLPEGLYMLELTDPQGRSVAVHSFLVN